MDDFDFSWNLFTQKGQSYDEVELLSGYTFEDRRGLRYRNVKWSVRTKTLGYEMYHIPEGETKARWEGVFHGRLMKEFMEMKKTK